MAAWDTDTPASTTATPSKPAAGGPAWDDPADAAPPPTQQNPGLMQRVEQGAKAAGKFALGMVPVAGPAVQAYQQGLDTQQKGIVSELAGFATRPPLPVKQATPETPEHKRAAVRAWQQRRFNLEQQVNNSPVGRATAAGLIDVPATWASFGLWGLSEKAVAQGVLHGATQEAAGAAHNAPLEEVMAVAKRLATRREVARRAALAVPPVVVGETQLAERKFGEGENVPLSQFLGTAAAGAAFGLALGQVSSKAGAGVVNETMVKVPYLAQQVRASQQLAQTIAKDGKVPVQQAAGAVYRMLRDEATDADRELVGPHLGAVANTDLGKMLKDRSVGPTKWNVDESANPTDPVVVTLDTPSGHQIRALKGSADYATLQKQIRDGEARIVSAVGPKAGIKVFRGRIPVVDRAKLSAGEISQNVEDRISRKMPAKLKQVLQLGYQPHPDTPYRPGEGYLEARRHGQPSTEVGEGRQPTQPPGRIALGADPHVASPSYPEGHPAEHFAALADELTDGKDGLKENEFKPVQSGDASYSHAHPWIDTKATDTTEVPIVVPATQEQALVTPSLTTDPHEAANYESHKIKLSPEAQNAELARQNPTPLPAETAFPASPDFVEKLHTARTSPELDAWIDTRSKIGKGERGRQWWDTVVGQVFKMDPHDPRLTPESASAAMIIQREHLGDLERAAKRGKISYDDPEAMRKLQTFHRFKDAWTQEQDIGGGPGLVVRESAIDTDGTIMSAHAHGDGTESVSKGRVAGTGVRRKATSLSQPQGDAPVWDFTNAVEVAHSAPDVAPTYQHLQKAAVAAEDVRKAVGTPTERAVPPIDTVIPPDEAAQRAQLDQAQATIAALKKQLKGFSKGAVRRTEWEPLDPNTNLLAQFARDLGHGTVELHPSGMVRAKLRVGGQRFVNLKFASEDEAAASIVDLVNRHADATRADADVERIIETGKLPAMAVNSGANDPLIRAMHTVGDPEFATDRPLSPGERFAKHDFFGILHTTEQWLGGIDAKVGRLANFMAHNYRLVHQQLRAESEAAEAEFYRRTRGKATVRGVESGTDTLAAKAWAETAAIHGDKRYQQHGELGAILGEKVAGVWVPHWYDITDRLRRSGHKVLRTFLDNLIDDGMGPDHNTVWQAYTALEHAENHESELAKATETLNRNRAARGQSQLSKTEVEAKLAEYARRRATIAPHLEFNRTGGDLYSDNIYAATRHAFAAMDRAVADRVVFGKKMERLAALVDAVRETTGSNEEANRVRLFFDAMRGKPYNGMGSQSELYNGLLGADRTQISTAFIKHLPQNYFTWQGAGLGKALVGLKQALVSLSSTEGREAAIRFGAIERRSRYYEGADDERWTHVTSLPEKLANIVTKPLEYTINYSRTIAAHVGHELFDDFIKDIDNPKSLKALNEVLHLDSTAAAYKSLDPAALDQLRTRAGISFANRNFFHFDPLSGPQALHEHPMFKLFLQFHNYLYSYTKLVTHELFGRDVPLARRARMAITMGLLMPPTTYAQAKLFSALGVSNRELTTFDKAVTKFKRDPGFVNGLSAIIAAHAASHSWGLFTGALSFLYTGNAEALKETWSSSPGANWIIDGITMGYNLTASAANYARGRTALSTYQRRKAGQEGAQVLGGPLAKGPFTKYALGGEPKRPSNRASSRWGRF